MTVTFLPPVSPAPSPFLGVSHLHLSLSVVVRGWWHFQFLGSTGCYTSSHFLLLSAPFRDQLPLAVLELLRFLMDLQKALFSLFRGCTMLDLLLSPMSITQHTTDTQQRPLTQIRMTISAMIWSPEEGGSELVWPSSRARFIPMLHSAVLRITVHVHRELLPAGLTSIQHLGI